MNIRRAEKKDTERLSELLRQVLDIHHEARPDLFCVGSAKYSEGELLEIIADDSRPIFVATDENSFVLGYCFCIIQSHENNNILTNIKTLYIDDLCVDAKARGRGIGRSLYSHALNYAKQIGCYNLTLNVWAGNDSALHFYRSLGLTEQKFGMEKIL